jgi:hypothetical protein
MHGKRILLLDIHLPHLSEAQVAAKTARWCKELEEERRISHGKARERAASRVDS